MKRSCFLSGTCWNEDEIEHYLCKSWFTLLTHEGVDGSIEFSLPTPTKSVQNLMYDVCVPLFSNRHMTSCISHTLTTFIVGHAMPLEAQILSNLGFSQVEDFCDDIESQKQAYYDYWANRASMFEEFFELGKRGGEVKRYLQPFKEVF